MPPKLWGVKILPSRHRKPVYIFFLKLIKVDLGYSEIWVVPPPHIHIITKNSGVPCAPVAFYFWFSTRSTSPFILQGEYSLSWAICTGGLHPNRIPFYYSQCTKGLGKLLLNSHCICPQIHYKVKGMSTKPQTEVFKVLQYLGRNQDRSQKKNMTEAMSMVKIMTEAVSMVKYSSKVLRVLNEKNDWENEKNHWGEGLSLPHTGYSPGNNNAKICESMEPSSEWKSRKNTGINNVLMASRIINFCLLIFEEELF